MPRATSSELQTPQLQEQGDVHLVDNSSVTTGSRVHEQTRSAFRDDVAHDRTSITPVSDDDPPVCNDMNSNRYDALSCWLWKLKLEIPDQQIEKFKITVVSSR